MCSHRKARLKAGLCIFAQIVLWLPDNVLVGEGNIDNEGLG